MGTAFRVGDRVRIPLGRRNVTGVISEDRGLIGVKGEQLYQILVSADPFEPSVYELPESEIEPLQESADTLIAMDSAKVIDYLKNGGLISILRSNNPGGGNQPRVWLRLDNLGNATYTNIKERGYLGGETVPFMTVRNDRVLSARRDEVSALLRSFGLDPGQVGEVLASVGIFPS